jgi:RNA 2',3'-cyclic 3'-phosphodiesterase
VLRGDGGVIGLTMLQDAVGSALEMAGLGSRAPHYTPHMTLLYGDRFVTDHPVEPVGWTVHEFVLVNSLLGRSRYLALARFALGAQA